MICITTTNGQIYDNAHFEENGHIHNTWEVHIPVEYRLTVFSTVSPT